MSLDNIFFKNRESAAQKLLEVLPLDSMRLEKWIVVACSYGGYEIAKIIADALDSEYELLFNEKIYAPNNEECEIAVVTELEEVLIHEELVKAFDIELDLVYLKSKDIFETVIKPKINRFRSGVKPPPLKGKNVLIVDEDINVGLVMMACIKTIINQGVKSISVATPLLSTASIKAIDTITDDLYYIKKLDHYIEADFYYDSLEKLSFEDIEELKKKDNYGNSM